MMKKRSKKLHLGGQAVIIAVLFFTVISTIIVFGYTMPAIRQIIIASNLVGGADGYFAAEAGMEDVVYRLKTGKQVSSSETYNFSGATVTINTTDSINGKTINAEASKASYLKKIEAKITEGNGASFNYGVQTGNGGINISGGSIINGNVYANGNIIGSDGSVINGTAIAANSAVLSANQTNNSPDPASQEIIFGDSNGTQDFAQSFKVTTSGPLNKIQLEMMRTSSLPADPTVRIVNDASGSPGSTVLDSTILDSNLLTTSMGWVEVVFSNNPLLVAGTTYWFVIDGSSNQNKYFTIAANNSYVDGLAKIGRYGNNWGATSPVGLDGYFKIYLGGLSASIYGNGGSEWYQPLVVEGDSWSHTIEQINTQGTLYCQNSINNAPAPDGTPCNTSRGDPYPSKMPLSDAQINAWKSEAAAGGVQGSTAVNWAGASIGPKKIDGNLTVSSGTLTLTGTVYVTGTITVSGGGKVVLHSGFGHNSGVLISDGRVSISGGGQFAGSGEADSYPLLITTSSCPNSGNCNGNPAIYASGGSGSVLLSAQNGTLQLNGGSAARTLSAYVIYLSGGGIINYDINLANITFANSIPGEWKVISWEEQ